MARKPRDEDSVGDLSRVTKLFKLFKEIVAAGVEVERHPGGGVPEDRLRRLHIDPGGDESGGRCSPRVVEPEALVPPAAGRLVLDQLAQAVRALAQLGDLSGALDEHARAGRHRLSRRRTHPRPRLDLVGR